MAERPPSGRGIPESAVAHQGIGKFPGNSRRRRPGPPEIAFRRQGPVVVVADPPLLRHVDAVAEHIPVIDHRRARGNPVDGTEQSFPGLSIRLDHPQKSGRILLIAYVLVIPVAVERIILLIAVRINSFVVRRIHVQEEPVLLQVVHAVRHFRGQTCFVQRRHQHGRKNGDDRNHDEQFDQGETLFHGRVLSISEQWC